MTAQDSSKIPVILAAGYVAGAVPPGPVAVPSQDGGILGVVGHPADGEYVIPLLHPADPDSIQVLVTPDGVGCAVDTDTSNASNPVVPSVTVYLSTSP